LAVVVRDGRFVRIGPAAPCAPSSRTSPVALPQRLLMPGLIDAHTHLTQALGKALAFGEPSEIFRRIWVPMESTLRPMPRYLSAKLAALEALRGGFTTVVDAGTRSSGAWTASPRPRARPASAACSGSPATTSGSGRRRRRTPLLKRAEAPRAS
jgi:5-methylthioadenosine/S-adenosylhomocysteine deaminase